MYDFSSFTDHRLRGLAEAVATRYLGQFEMTSKDYLELADSFYSQGFSRGVLPRPYLTELLQIIVNSCIYQAAEVHHHFDPTVTDNVPSWYALLNRWGTLLPTHTLRDEDKNDMQQYSTPPEYAYIAAWCCQPSSEDIALEPSAGLAGLAVMLAPWVKKIVVNEYDRERIELLHGIRGWNEVLQSDAGMIHLHPFAATGKPTLVLMNPPFSMDRGERDKMTAARHIERALQVLEPGGRLVAILPGGIERSFNQHGDDGQFGMADQSSTFRGWWAELRKQYTVRCNVGILGSVYKKFGTATRTRLVVIDKVGPQGALETQTLVSGQAWIASPLMLMGDNDFVNGVVNMRQRALSPKQKQEIELKQKAVRLGDIGGKSREKYGLPAIVVAPTSASNADTGRSPKGEALPVSLCNVDTQHGEAEKLATRILFTLGLGGYIYEYDDFNAILDRGQKQNSGLMDLNIERCGDELIFTHWFEQNGDLCRDSEVRFLAPLDSGLLKLTGITGWGPQGEFHDYCKWGPNHEKECRSYAGTMLKNIKHFISSKDIEKLKLNFTDREEPVQPIDISEEPVQRTGEIVHVEVEEEVQKDMLDTFQGYRPFVTVTGSKPHTVSLVESNTMRLAKLPIATANVHLPKEAVELGHISDAQLENTIYAVHAHEQLLRDGITRKAYLIGDGTGVGKGTEASSVAMHYFLKAKGKVRVVWMSKEFSLIKDAIRDWTFIGGDADFIYSQDKFKEPTIPMDTGILFTTYTTMSMRGNPDAKTRSINRLQQLISWLEEGNTKGYTTLICFDEAHLMGNATSTAGVRGTKKASQRAVAGLELMAAVPQTRILFLSATAATEVHNLGYAAERLGLCGTDVPAFPDLAAFISNIDGGGMLAMELVASDMKRMGLYNARSLSYEGTSFRLLEHPLTSEQNALYNEACYFWRLCYDYMKSSFQDNGTDGRGKAQTMGQFWGGAQRFFNQILTSMQTPSAIEDMLAMLKTDHSIVVQLVNTNEAATNRVVADAVINDMDLDELDITPRDMLLQLIRTNYPTIQYETVKDKNGNSVQKPMVDSNGDFIHNPDAIEKRDDLLLRVAEMRVPQGALDMLIDRMEEEGYDVAEVTGRSKRFVMRKDDITGTLHRVMEPRSKKKGDAEAAEFMAGKRRVLVFSGAGNTGRSFQSDLRCQNQQRRMHYVLQAGWRADEAIQGLGRTHRTNQANAPEYILVTTDLPGQKRFITSIARRIEQLGCLTRGNRAAAANDMFKAEDNLETEWAKTAVNSIFIGLHMGHAHLLAALGGNVGFQELCDMMGFNLEDPETGSFSTERIPGITQFLNRVLFLPTELQRSVFGLFEQSHTDILENAAAEGLLDKGVEKIRGDEVTKVQEKLVHVDKDTGAHTYVIQLDVKTKLRRLAFEEAYQVKTHNVMGTEMGTPSVTGFYLADNSKGVNYAGTGGFLKFIQNIKSQRVYGVWRAGMKQLRNGGVEPMLRLVGPTSTIRETDAEFHASKHRELTVGEAERIWAQELYKATEYDTHQSYLITGAVMPVWDKLGSAARKVKIMVAETTDTHERILGRLIYPDEVSKVLTNLGMGSQGVYMTPKQLTDDVLEQASILHLANGWQIRRRRLQSGIHSMVVVGPTRRADIDGLEGMTAELQGRDMVFVLATPQDEDERVRIFSKLVERRPVVKIERKGATADVLDKEAERNLEKASEIESVKAYSFDDLITWHDAGLKSLAKAVADHKPGEEVASLFTVKEEPPFEPKPTPTNKAMAIAERVYTKLGWDDKAAAAHELATPAPTTSAPVFEVVANPNAVPFAAMAASIATAVGGEVVGTMEPTPMEVASPEKIAPVHEAPLRYDQMSNLDKQIYLARQSNAKKKAGKVVKDPQQISLF